MYKFLLLLACVCIQSGCASRTVKEPNKFSKIEKSVISDICFNGQFSSAFQPTDQSRFLLEVEKRFSNQSYRKSHSTEFIASLNKIIENSDFKFLLQCKANWEKGKNHLFKVSFPENLKNMELEYQEKKGPDSITLQILEIHLQLNMSVQKSLPTYMHELLHVCQHDATNAIQRRFDEFYSHLSLNEQWTVAQRMWRDEKKPPNGFQIVESKSVSKAQDLYRAINRNRMLNEISAMILMRNAYEYFVRTEPGYCEEDTVEPKSKKNLALAYSTGTDELKSGIFAQRVLTWYNAESLEGLFQSDSEPVKYPASNNGLAFKMKLLDPIFKSQIEGLGITVRQGD